jgi:hypothetical protein
VGPKSVVTTTFNRARKINSTGDWPSNEIAGCFEKQGHPNSVCESFKFNDIMNNGIDQCTGYTEEKRDTSR